jgi:hypothetical protein
MMAQMPLPVKTVSKLGVPKKPWLSRRTVRRPDGAPWLDERLDFPASWDFMSRYGRAQRRPHAAANSRQSTADRYKNAANSPKEENSRRPPT